MRTGLWGLCGALLLSSFSLCSEATAQLAGTVRVLGIVPTTGVTRVASFAQTLGEVRLAKFTEEPLPVPAAILAVTWEQMPGLAPRGVQLVLEYRMDGQSHVRALRHTLPDRERGPSTHRFEIPLTRETGWRVSAWRLRLMHDNTALEEYTSSSWR